MACFVHTFLHGNSNVWELFVALSTSLVWLAEDVGVAPGYSGIERSSLQHFKRMIIGRETQESSLFNSLSI